MSKIFVPRTSPDRAGAVSRVSRIVASEDSICASTSPTCAG